MRCWLSRKSHRHVQAVVHATLGGSKIGRRAPPPMSDCISANHKIARLYLNTAPIIFILKIWEVQDIHFLPCNFQQDRPINFGDIRIRDFRIRFSPLIPGTIINRVTSCSKITMSQKSYRNHWKSKNRDFRKSHYFQWKTWFPVGIHIGIEKT